jgi:hypothetical protein
MACRSDGTAPTTAHHAKGSVRSKASETNWCGIRFVRNADRGADTTAANSKGVLRTVATREHARFRARLRHYAHQASLARRGEGQHLREILAVLEAKTKRRGKVAGAKMIQAGQMQHGAKPGNSGLAI